MPTALTDADKVIRNDTGKEIAAAIRDLAAPEADKVAYDNTSSGLTADNAQDAIDELKSDIDSVELADLDDVNLTSPQDEDELHYDSATSKWKNIAKKIYEKSASGSLVSFNDGGDNIPLKSLIANITAVQSGSGTPSPDNNRAISGWSGANVVRKGTNQWDEQWELGSYNEITGAKVDGTSTIRNKNIICVVPNTTYYYKSSFSCRRLFYDKNGNFISVDSLSNNTTFTIPSNIYYMNFRSGSGTTTYDNNTSINYPSTDTSYHAYTGTQITIPFGQTVYGGTLDVLSGVLAITHGIVDLGSLTWFNEDGTASGLARAGNVSETIPLGAKFRQIPLCSQFVGVQTKSYRDFNDGETAFSNSEAQPFIRARSTIFVGKTDAEIKSLMSGVQFVYELATPIIYQLTPVQVKTLLGLNNIFADTGDISLSYFTQNANAINDIAESNTRTALNTDVPKTDLTDIFVTGTKNNTGSTISAGTYFYANGQLALCKSAISANADLTLNTNYELVTAGALNKLILKTYEKAINGVTYNLYMTGQIGVLTIRTGSLTNAVSAGGELIALTDFSSDFTGKKFLASFQFCSTLDTTKRFDCVNNSNHLITISALEAGISIRGCVSVVIG